MGADKLQLRSFWFWVLIASYILFAIFLIYPLSSLFSGSFQDITTGAFTLKHFITFFTKRYYYNSLFNSFKVTICVTVLTMLVGIPLAYIMSVVKIRGKDFLQILIIISMLSPPFIGAYSWILLFGRNGFCTNFLRSIFGVTMPSVYGFNGILLVFTLKLFPFIFIYVSGALKKLDVSLVEAAEGLGCHPLRKLFTIVLPLVLPTAMAGALLVFINALADFATPMLIGEGYMTMPVMIYNEFISEVGGSANFAASISVILVFLTAVVFLLQKYVVGTKSYVMSSLKPIQPKRMRGWKNVLAHLFCYSFVLLAIIPQATVIFTSFLKTSGPVFLMEFSLDSYTKILSKSADAILNTYRFALLALLIIVVLGMLIAYLAVRRKNIASSVLDTISMFPYVIPGSVLGITLLLAFNKRPLLLAGTSAIIVITFVIRRISYTIRSSSAILYQIAVSTEEAAIGLGDSELASFLKVTTRIMMPGVLSGAILSWITCINELSASVLLYTGKTKTMSVAIFTEVNRGNYGTAAALSAILTLTTVVSLLILFKVTGNKEVSM
ncbi:MAG: iron ABC transporter permease [Synergistaceae bacterium]|nr:iron ABC transporter permease [Synergistaceae bacterium]